MGGGLMTVHAKGAIPQDPWMCSGWQPCAYPAAHAFMNGGIKMAHLWGSVLGNLWMRNQLTATVHIPPDRSPDSMYR